MSSTSRIDENTAYRQIIERLLRERRDVSPSEIVELLGDYVIWGPLDPPAEAAEPDVPDRAPPRTCPSRPSSRPDRPARGTEHGRACRSLADACTTTGMARRRR